ncbi:isochorismatase family cysteine hydrolase [Anaerovoracaceae bacterium 41-7]|jgi:nicotinamidase/pyrazinamidase|uniref:Cysteine hydrolase n=1 Tax=Anaerotruncus colihominis TaxID=169435 RepID=A0A845QGZ1_9FIRM|nr:MULTISPECIES: isochorismatase family cysteine hydrolase [Clostridia]MCI9476919.1 cysteine hydrolase [Emergencia sp.]MCI9640313.1 cysteine hydrolase [Emergencia sp.]NBH60095.1 cysteine hydrolase [Anaerotruncus colihominis]NCE99909.1 cysteine hydrolase [Emergencia sp. 1XD21-10]NCF00749.1 cysteine hydrolase [Anaerotruncus sp. 80]
MEKNKILLVIDMQKDFVTGALANQEAQQIIENIKKKIESYKERGLPVFFTRDTHGEDYLNTQEGRLLPVPHCIKGSDGWQIIDELADYVAEGNTLDKPSFGCLDLPKWLCDKLAGASPAEIELCGVCTDICVISNGMILKAAYPETPITVEGSCCAGVTPESHNNALEAMKMCQILVR